MGKIITLDSNSESIQYLCKVDKKLNFLINTIGTISYEVHDDSPYLFLIHEIIEQMLSIKSGNKIFSRLQNLCMGNITPEVLSNLTNEEIKSIGTSSAKVNYIRNITEAVLCGNLDFQELSTLSDKEVLKKLTSIKGIGKWTANMYLIFVLNRLDILPTTDVAFLQAYKWLYNCPNTTEAEIKENTKSWHPYCSIASRYLYKALDSGLTKNKGC